MKRIELQPAYILHRRPYRETSYLIEFFTPLHGCFGVIAKGVRKIKSSTQGILQPFQPLLISCQGKGELLTLSYVEANGQAVALEGECLFAGFYLNELLLCLLQKWDPHSLLFQYYERALQMLTTDVLEQKALRSFEKVLLEEIGYGLLPTSALALQNSFHEDKYYRFTPDQGFVLQEVGHTSSLMFSGVFSGRSLLAIAKEDWQEPETLRDAKRLTRMVLTPLLGTRPLHSRKLFMKLEEIVE